MWATTILNKTEDNSTLEKTSKRPCESKQHRNKELEKYVKPTLKTVRQDFTVLRSPCGHLANTDTPLVRTAAESPAEITDRWLKQSPGITDSRYYGLTDTSVGPDSTTVSTILYCSNSRYNGHQSAPCDILEELSQVLIYFFLFFSLKSEHSDSRLTWSFYETTVITCKRQSWCT